MAAVRNRPVVLFALAVLRVSGVAWDPAVDPACCAYPEHDPRDYNYPYSHLLYSEVVPDVTGAFVAMTALRLAYAPDAEVSYGKWLAPEVVREAPVVRFAIDHTAADEPPLMHTLIAVDPDVPSRDRPDGRERVLWIVHDIPANQTASGKVLLPYAPPEPTPCDPVDSLCLAEHRVTFLLWEQPRGPLRLEPEDEMMRDPRAGRLRFKARDFAARHGLGLPLAVNFFETSRSGQAMAGGADKKDEL